MERESTDPLAVGLLHDIVLELQADLQAVATKLRRLAEPQPDNVVPLRSRHSS
jgi:hypothetical protein